MNEERMFLYQSRKLDPPKVWILFLLLGFGFSYEIMDQMEKQFFYFLTLGGLGIWAIYRFFTLNSKVKEYNKKIALEVGFEQTDLMKLGLI